MIKNKWSKILIDEKKEIKLTTGKKNVKRVENHQHIKFVCFLLFADG